MKQLILISLLLCSAFAAEGTDSTSNRKKRKREDRPVRVVPIPEISSNPTFGTGGGAMVLMTYPVSKTDTISPKSTLFAKGTYYNTHSYMFLVGNRFFLKEDKFRIPLAAGQIRINNDFDYTFTVPEGIPDSILPPEMGVNLKYRGTSTFFYLGCNYNVWKRLYVGVDYMFMNFINDDVALKIGDVSIPDSLTKHLLDLDDSRQSGFYLNAEWDSRDNQFAPLKGILGSLQFGIFPKALGSTTTFETLTSSVSYYHSFKPNHTWASQLAGVNTFGDVKGNNLATFGMGKSGSFRGYQNGKYRGEHLIQLQTEYRWFFSKRFGLAGFTGVAKFFGDEENKTTDEFLPTIGGGFRFLVDPKQRITIRMDGAWGRNGESGFYLSIAEAF